jgi:hypothetical protein
MRQEKGFILVNKRETIMPALLQANLRLIMVAALVPVTVVLVGFHAKHVIVPGVLVAVEAMVVVSVEGQLNNEF